MQARFFKTYIFKVEAFQADSSEEEEARVAAERRKKSIRRPPKIHAQVGWVVLSCGVWLFWVYPTYT